MTVVSIAMGIRAKVCFDAPNFSVMPYFVMKNCVRVEVLIVETKQTTNPEN
jgi:hypothetical protein